MDDHQLSSIIIGVLAKAPQWIRHDLAAKDAAMRTRAEESLAAMIAAAISSAKQVERPPE